MLIIGAASLTTVRRNNIQNNNRQYGYWMIMFDLIMYNAIYLLLLLLKNVGNTIYKETVDDSKEVSTYKTRKKYLLENITYVFQIFFQLYIY